MKTFVVPMMRASTVYDVAQVEVEAMSVDEAIAEATRRLIADEDVSYNETEPELGVWTRNGDVIDVTPAMEHESAEQWCLDSGLEFKEDIDGQWMWRQRGALWYDTGMDSYENAVQVCIKLHGMP